MTARSARLDDLLAAVTEGLGGDDALPPYQSIALDVLADALVEAECPSPASAFVAAKYVLARHARELADLLLTRPAPAGVEPRYWAAAQLREHATTLDGQQVQR
ncbi:hypothetical protein [Streptomyces sp. NPDC102487]|uniref:hypothetical protein n=1 Tax=Streptomyces sp. NPDC102487 TaxID=3366182 RepID=UPI0038034CC5